MDSTQKLARRQASHILHRDGLQRHVRECPGRRLNSASRPKQVLQLHMARIVAVNLQARALFVDFWIIGDAAREFPGDSWEKHEALQVCNAIMDAFIAGDGSQDSIIKGEKSRNNISVRMWTRPKSMKRMRKLSSGVLAIATSIRAGSGHGQRQNERWHDHGRINAI